MVTSTSVYAAARDALAAAGIHVVDGPADDLPTVDGLVGQAVVLWPRAGLHQTGRAVGSSHGREDRLSCVCVGATAFDALAVYDRVHAVLDGFRAPSSSPMWQLFNTQPVSEPDSDPVRVSLTTEYSTITKG